jgi:hypothetical protein
MTLRLATYCRHPPARARPVRLESRRPRFSSPRLENSPATSPRFDVFDVGVFGGGTYTTFDAPLGARGGTYATGINNADQIVGYFIDVNGGIDKFVYSGGRTTSISRPDELLE